MKTLQKLISVFLLLLCISALALPAMASAYAEHNGLEVTVEMDKEQYDVGEPITATITVLNTNNEAVTIVNLKQLIPEGYELAEGSEDAKVNVTLAAGETLVLQVTFVGQPAENEEGDAASGSFFDKLLYGYTWGIPNLLLALIVVAAIVIFMILT